MKTRIGWRILNKKAVKNLDKARYNHIGDDYHFVYKKLSKKEICQIYSNHYHIPDKNKFDELFNYEKNDDQQLYIDEYYVSHHLHSKPSQILKHVVTCGSFEWGYGCFYIVKSYSKKILSSRHGADFAEDFLSDSGDHRGYEVVWEDVNLTIKNMIKAIEDKVFNKNTTNCCETYDKNSYINSAVKFANKKFEKILHSQI